MTKRGWDGKTYDRIGTPQLEWGKVVLDRLELRGNETILDAGCGSGRDALFFKRQGYSVVAFDASRELAAIASQSLGESVRVLAFLDLNAVAEFDGIWACASLLHVCSNEMNGVLHRLTHALKPGAPMYVSFKLGTEEGQRSERFFNDYDELKFHRLLRNHPDLAALKLWRTADRRPGRQHEIWLNAIVAKKGVKP